MREWWKYLVKIIEEDKDLELVGKAHNGEEICKIIREKEPDVVVLDIIMPKMDGLAVMERFVHEQQSEENPGVYCGFRQWEKRGSRKMRSVWERIIMY